MGEYRLSIYLRKQIGFCIGYDYQICIVIPFITIRIATSKYAKGFYFGK